jgi:hypothetical protein
MQPDAHGELSRFRAQPNFEMPDWTKQGIYTHVENIRGSMGCLESMNREKISELADSPTSFILDLQAKANRAIWTA